MTPREQDIARLVERVGKAIAEAFNEADVEEGGPSLGFALWVFEFREEPFVAMVSNEFSNARRPELIRCMREHLRRLEAEQAAEETGRH